ncbi:MAG: DUF4159 domain-containing protein [Elusimicrobia bacterium]|nr:DUF4159 domain-containing protein [Elusimicrobiota bacterium]
MKNCLAAVLVLIAALPSWAFRPDQVRLGVLRYGDASDFDPYPTVWREVARALEEATSVEFDPLVKEPVRPTAQELQSHALVFLLATPAFKGWSPSERAALANWVKLGGGTIVVLGAEGLGAAAARGSRGADSDGLDARIRREMELIFEGAKLEAISPKHALFKSFYLVRGTGGVLERSRVVEGIRIGERYGLIFSRNDLLGALLKDAEGRYLFGCYPGGEEQRKESFKLVVNIFLYALTGTYKEDIIHLPYILQKLKR